MIVGRWYVQLAAMALVFTIMHLDNIFLIFILCLFIPFLYFSLTWCR